MQVGFGRQAPAEDGRRNRDGASMSGVMGRVHACMCGLPPRTAWLGTSLRWQEHDHVTIGSGIHSLARRGSEGSSDVSDARVGLEVRVVGLRRPPQAA